ncbi:MAG: hypothetical protein ACP5OG_01160 [Candidatus Nanoarchaeia archaeon]
MEKGGKIVARAVFLLILISLFIGLSFVFADHVVTNTEGGTNFTISQGVAAIFNVSVNNTDTTDTGNISQVNITFYQYFNFTGLNGSTADSEFSNTSISLSWRNTTLYLINGNQTKQFSFGLSSNYIGVYNITVTSTNETGSYSTNISVIINDIINPQVTIVSPVSSANYSSNIIEFNITATDNNFLSSCWYSLNNGVTNNTMHNASASLFNATNISIPDGTYTAIFYCNDSYNNINDSESVTFTKDTQGPSVVFISPLNASIYREVVDINYSASDATTSLGNCWYGNTTTNSTPGSCNNFTSLSIIAAEGSNTWTIYANDSLGNLNYSVVTFTKDTVAPGLSIISPGNATYSSNFSLDVNYTVSGTPASCWYSNDSMTVNTALESCENITTVVWSEGAHSVIVYVNDTVGNLNYSSVTFTIDSVAPTLIVYNPMNKTYYANQSITIYFNASDSNLGSLWYNNGSNEAYTSPVTINFTAIGNYEFIFFANDSANNIVNKTINFSVIEVPSNTALITNQTVLEVTQNTTQVVVGYNTTVQIITIPSLLSNDSIKLNLSQVVENGNVTLTNVFTLSRQSTSGVNYTAIINASTTISGGVNWSGDIILPLVNTSVTNFTAPSGSADIIVEMGSRDFELNFSQPVKIVIGGMATKSAAWTRNTTLIDIVACTSAVDHSNINAQSPRECYHDEGSDLVIWTYHFTSFGAYTPEEETPAQNNNRGGGGGSVVSGWVKEIKLNQSELNLGQTLKAIKTKYRMTFNVKGMGHSVEIKNITPTLVTVVVASTPQTAVMSAGETKKFDVDSDNTYDLSLYVSSINYPSADVIIKTISEEIISTGTEPAVVKTPETEETGQVPQESQEEVKKTIDKSDAFVLWMIVAIIIVALTIAFILKQSKRNKKAAASINFY